MEQFCSCYVYTEKNHLPIVRTKRKSNRDKIAADHFRVFDLYIFWRKNPCLAPSPLRVVHTRASFERVIPS